MIIVEHGFYVLDDMPYFREGYYNDESRRYMPICVKFLNLLREKAHKFYHKYGVRTIPFTVGRDPETEIAAIAICHTHFDDYDQRIGEDIVVGRVKRMRGEIREPYDLHARHRYKNKDGYLCAGDLKYPYIYKMGAEI